jgi:hypothetical protein
MTQQPLLKIAVATYGHTKDIKSGAAAIAGVDPDFVEVAPIIGAFRRMVRDVEFDVCEMAPTTYMIARALGAPFIALPIFLMRRFHHGGFAEIQAGFTGPAGVGRAGPPVSGWDKAGAAAAAADTYPELIANVEQVEADWFRRSGIYPIHGLVVVKDEHVKRHPWLARSLMDAFVAAKKPYLDALKRNHGDSPEDKRYRNFLSLMSDPLPYGMAANRASIEALVTYSLQQKLIPSRPQLDQVFVEIDP